MAAGHDRAVSDDTIRRVAGLISLGRVGIGLVSVLTPGLARKLLGVKDDGPGIRMVARLFGVREVAVGAHTLMEVQQQPRQPRIYAMNAAVDAGDAGVMLITLAGGKGMRRAAASSLFIAVPVVATWLWLRRASS
jgi:hypothetical protein